MSSISFVDEIPIDTEHTLEQLTGRFQSPEHGTAELVKNAKDQYSARGVSDVGERVIVVLIDSETRSVGVLDFAGAAEEDFDEWKKWSSRRERRRAKAADIEAGHGNGGKAFMVQGSREHSSFESVFEGKRTKMGYLNSDPKRLFLPGYFTDGEAEIRGWAVDDTREALQEALTVFNLGPSDLPGDAIEAFERRDCFTLVCVHGLRDWAGRRDDTVRRLTGELAHKLTLHPQAALSIESCTVFVIRDGALVGGGRISPRYPEPLEGFDDLDPIPVPDTLTDPKTKETVSTGPADAGMKYLQLRTSDRYLRMEDTKPLNVIRVRNERNVVGSLPVADLHARVNSGYVYGELRVPVLGPEHTEGAGWTTLRDTELTRALRRWVAEQVEELSNRIQEERAVTHRPEDMDRTNAGLEQFRKKMRDFLEGDVGAGGGGRGEEGPDTSPDNPPAPAPRGDTVREIVLESGARSVALAAGTRIPIRARAYDVDQDGERLVVPEVSYEMLADATNIVDFADGVLYGIAPGRVAITLKHVETGVESNPLQVEVLNCVDAEVRGVPDRLLFQRERLPLTVDFLTGDGDVRSDLLLEASVDEEGMGRVNRYGVATAGNREGTLTARFRFAEETDATVAAPLLVGTEEMPRPPRKGDDGGDVPMILLCGTEAPGMDDYAPDQRTISASSHEPTIIDFYPEFEHVIFLNPDSRESIQVRRGPGRTGVVGISTATYLQFLALKCFEILKRLKVRQAVREQMVGELEFRQQFALAEQDCAGFIEAAFDMAKDLASGGNGGS